MARLDQVSFKASHNSYDRDELPFTDQIAFDPSQPHQGGCVGLELDLAESPRFWLWSVNHSSEYDGSADRQLVEYLRGLRRWSDRRVEEGGHDLVWVTLDLKSTPKNLEGFGDGLDDVLDRELGADRMYLPAELQGGAESLVEGAVAAGWPDVNDLQNRIVVCLSGDEASKAAYFEFGDTSARLCFADRSFSPGEPSPSTARGDRVVFNISARSSAPWQEAVRTFAGQSGFITRLYTLNTEDLWQQALTAGGNILATDKVRNHEWATVGTTPFRSRPASESSTDTLEK
ncbi:MAG: hypothetical protein ACI8TP_004902 [Acidimicrobiales bacterium]|jgi:hypothetical protein